MYCSSCGAFVVRGLSYCNACGAKLTAEKRDDATSSSEVKPQSLVFGMVATLVFGFVGITFLMMAMKMVGFNVGQILALTILSFTFMLLVEGVFIWQLVRRKRGAEETGDAALSKEQTTKELHEAPALLEAMPVPSVTEHTTRTFEPIYSERKPK
jgi:hypothetical protein